MKSFKIYESKNGELLNPTSPESITKRAEVIIKATSRYDALIKHFKGTSHIYFKGKQPYYNPFYNVKYIALLKK